MLQHITQQVSCLTGYSYEQVTRHAATRASSACVDRSQTQDRLTCAAECSSTCIFSLRQLEPAPGYSGCSLAYRLLVHSCWLGVYTLKHAMRLLLMLSV
jgi:hypothetical protein